MPEYKKFCDEYFCWRHVVKRYALLMSEVYQAVHEQGESLEVKSELEGGDG